MPRLITPHVPDLKFHVVDINIRYKMGQRRFGNPRGELEASITTPTLKEKPSCSWIMTFLKLLQMIEPCYWPVVNKWSCLTYLSLMSCTQSLLESWSTSQPNVPSKVVFCKRELRIPNPPYLSGLVISSQLSKWSPLSKLHFQIKLLVHLSRKSQTYCEYQVICIPYTRVESSTDLVSVRQPSLLRSLPFQEANFFFTLSIISA